MNNQALLLSFVVVYLVISIIIGLLAARLVKNSTDYVAAGRRLPLFMVITTVFATWFGSETVLGISATFLKDGMRGLWSDPFGASLCLILAGLFFARKLYRMNLVSLGDYYRLRFGRKVELLCSTAIVLSYLGWVSAQVSALGLVFNILSSGAVSLGMGMVIGSFIVVIYTLYGGMWSVAVTDFIQMIIIIIGLVYIAWLTAGMAGGAENVIAHAADAGKFNLLPKLEMIDIVAFVAGILTMGFGSIPQQDVFQRINSANSERAAVHGSVIGGSFYFVFAFVPIFIAYSATLIDPALVSGYLAIDNAREGSQQILPQLILQKTPLFAQVMFFGALLSAIKSAASATLLAPSITFSENILRPLLPHLNDEKFLRMTRIVVLIFSVLVTLYAVFTTSSIHGMVESAYKVTLAMAFVPLAAGLYWQRATTQGALASIGAGLLVWLGLEMGNPEFVLPPHFAGMLAGVAGMVLGSLLPQWIANEHRHVHHVHPDHPHHNPMIH